MNYYSDFKTRLIELTPIRGDLKPLAEAIGVTENAVSQWRAGRNKPTFDKFQMIADYYGVSFDWLAGRSDVRAVDPEAQAVSARYGLNEVVLLQLESWKDVPFISAEQLNISDANKTTGKTGKQKKNPEIISSSSQERQYHTIDALNVVVTIGSDFLELIYEYITHDFTKQPVSLSGVGTVLEKHLKKNPDSACSFYSEAIHASLESVRETYQEAVKNSASLDTGN